jgi:hypothetical protein
MGRWEGGREVEVVKKDGRELGELGELGEGDGR